MKKNLLLLGLALVVGSFSFIACDEDDDSVVKEPCEENDYGSVTVTNNSGEYWVFDVTYEKNGSEWTTNEEVTINDGESYTWEEVGAGTVAIWVSDPTHDWTIAKEISLDACESHTYYANDRCQLFDWGTATVVNGGDFTLVVDVSDETGWIEERTLYAGYETDYQVKSGDVTFGARAYSGDSWTFSDPYDVDQCGTFEFTWNAKKMTGNSKKGNLKVNYVTPKKVGSEINLNELPKK